MDYDKQQKREDQEAIEKYGLLLNIAVKVYGIFGTYYHSLGHYHKGKENLELHLSIANLIGYKTGTGAAYRKLGNCYRSLGQYDKAIEHLESSLNIAKRAGDKAGEGISYGDLGICYDTLGQYHKAIEHHELCLSIAKQIGNKAEEARAYGNFGACYFSFGQYDKAIEHLELSLAKQVGDKAGEGTIYGNLGTCYCALGQYDKAIKHHELTLNISKQLGNKFGEGIAYDNLGACYFLLGQCNKALQYHEFSLDIAQQVRDIEGEGTSYGNIGICYQHLGQYEKAIEHHKLSLNIAKQIGHKTGEEKAQNNLGTCYCLLGQYDQAIEHLELSLNIAKEIGDKNGEGKTYNNLGTCNRSLGQYEKAIKHHELGLDIAKRFRDKAGEGTSYVNISACYCCLGEYDKAREHLELGLNIAKQIGNKHVEGVAYGNLGKCYSVLGQYDKAIEHHELSLNIAKEIGHKAGEGTSYVNLGKCYESLGQFDKAIEHYKLGLNIAKEIGDKNVEGIGYGNLGICYHCLGQNNKAKEHLELSLNIAKQIGDKAAEGAGYGALGACYRSLGQYDKAREYHELCLSIAKQIGNKSGEGAAYGNLGNCFRSLGQYEKAKKLYNLELNIAKQSGQKSSEGSVHNNLGLCYWSLGQYDKAEREFRSSVECFQELFKSVPNQDNLKVSFLDMLSKLTSSLLELLLIQDKTDDALVFAEMQRSRALAILMLKRYNLKCDEREVLDLLQTLEVVKTMDTTVLYFALLTSVICIWIIKLNGDVKHKVSKFEVSPESLENDLTKNFCAHEDRDLNSLINDLRKMLRSRCTVQCEDRSLSFLYQEEATEQTKHQPNPDFPFTTTSEEMPVPEQGVARHGPTSASVVQTQENDMSSKRRGGTKCPDEGPLKELFELLLAPVRHLVEKPQVVVVPDGALPLVPFAALIDENGRYVAESLQVRLVPSLATAKMIREYPQEPGAQGSPLIVGDPDASNFKAPRLPSAEKEACVIGQLLNVQPLTGKKATRKAVLDKLESANLIHIAAHGDVERGEILLAPSPGVDKENIRIEDVMLTISHLENKSVRAKLVVLSCCYSGRGEIKSEGVIGIARAFLGAGARSVIVTLWAVDDKATLYSMGEFYKHLAGGEKASEALSRAMKAMREIDAFCHPYFWAPFVLIGDDVAPFGMS